MKKLNVLLIVAMLAAALVAANPAGKLVRLEVINASGDTVYIKLEGKHTGAFYYLTIADSDTTTFTILVDDYKRTTWACNGIKSSGSLVMSGNVRLKFVQCGSFPIRRYGVDLNDDGDLFDEFWVDKDRDGCVDNGEYIYEGVYYGPNFGEPTQEKVVYWASYGNWRWIKYNAGDENWYYYTCTGGWDIFGDCLGWTIVPSPLYSESFALWGKFWAGVAWRTTKFPLGIWMRYRY